MKNKLVIRILGAFASALVIASVFVPFVSVTGYSQSLWQTSSSLGTLYLPIMILVFGAIGVLVFAINKKTELAYASTGALLFYLIMQTIPIIEQGTFSTLSVGFYFLAVGAILMGVLAFLSSIKPKQKEQESSSVVEKKDILEDTMLTQIDRLYNNEAPVSNNMEINQLADIQPLQSSVDLPIAPLQSTQQLAQIEPIQQPSLEIPVSPLASDEIGPLQPISQSISTEPVLSNPTIQEPKKIEEVTSLESLPSNESLANPTAVEPITPIAQSTPVETNGVNPTVAEFAPAPVAESAPAQEAPASVNPIVAEFASVPAVESAPEPAAPTNVNPTVAEFASVQVAESAPVQEAPASVNPTVAEFSSSTFPQPSMLGLSNNLPSEVKEANPTGEEFTIQPLTSTSAPSVDLLADNDKATKDSNPSANLDIFG